MATLGELTRRVPIAPKRNSINNQTPTVSLDGNTELIDDAVSEIRRYVNELTNFPIQPYPETNQSNQQITTPSLDQPVFADQNSTELNTQYPPYDAGLQLVDQSNFEKKGYGLPKDGSSETTTDGVGVFSVGVLSNNRFSGITNSRRFIDNQNNEITTEGATVAVNGRLGQYDPNYEGLKKANNKRKREVDDVTALKNIGLKLLLESSGHKKEAKSISRDSRASNLRSQGISIAAIPSALQLGLTRIDGDRLLAGKSITVPTDQEDNGSGIYKPAEVNGYSGENSPSGRSFGNMNSPLQKFTDNRGQVAIATAGALSVVAIATVFSAINRGNRKMVVADVRPADLPKGRRGLISIDSTGDSEDSPVLDALVNVGFIPEFGIETTHAPTVCLATGIRKFFGIDGRGGGFINILANPGYYTNIIRAVVRDFNQISNAFQDLGSNPVSGLQNIVEAIENSTTFRFLRAMVALGEAALNSADGSQGPVIQPQTRLPYTELSSMYYGMNTILPKSFTSSATIAHLFGNSSAVVGKILAESEVLNPGSAPVDSISIEAARELEARLGAQGFPLTFHDLRTNEILQFGAFVDDISDGFDATYQESAAYGRVDEVMTYQSTKRNISISFFIVATNPKDHDLMWRKINKLITLVYPQYSRGRLIQKNGNSFRMPFSQVITASPMIRLRFGETITGNYSRFNLSRLFGTGEAMEGSSVTGEIDGGIATARATGASGNTATANAEFDSIVAQLVEESLSNFRLQDTALNDTLSNSAPDGNAAQYFQNAFHDAAQTVNEKYSKGFNKNDVVITRRDLHVVIDRDGDSQNVRQALGSAAAAATGRTSANDNSTIQKALIPANTKLKIIKAFKDENSQGLPLLYRAKIYNRGSASPDLTFMVDFDSLTYDPSDAITDSLFNLAGASGDGNQVVRVEDADNGIFDIDRLSQFSESVRNFFGRTESGQFRNPIIRSFDQTQSEGLAGFITSMNFDYNESQYDTTPGSRAPTLVKVNIAFSPIHDLPPGLDADGANRAPIYKVGHINRLLAGVNTPGNNPAFNDFETPSGDGWEISSMEEFEARNNRISDIYDQRQAAAQRRAASQAQAQADADSADIQAENERRRVAAARARTAANQQFIENRIENNWLLGPYRIFETGPYSRPFNVDPDREPPESVQDGFTPQGRPFGQQ